ncbi:hypothetical protein C1H46_037338 [Malus baccata]|uniref:Uncharacterized protein n=1 Tax=Malus baccata TaxID=106549 RepID=A0A540KSD0_MALBA|nr:hypothetical protein C1H46_037338 [Malus baccata]
MCKSRNNCLRGSKFFTPSCLLNKRIAILKFPAAACSAARDDFWDQIWLTGIPGVGATNTEERALLAIFGVSISGGSSRSSRSHPPSIWNIVYVNKIQLLSPISICSLFIIFLNILAHIIKTTLKYSWHDPQQGPISSADDWRWW